MLVRLALLAAAALFLVGAAPARKPPPTTFKRIATGFGPLTTVTTAPNDARTLYVLAQRGTINLVRGGRRVGTFLDLTSRVNSEGEHGLLGLAFHPDYARNHLFYVDYTDLHGDTHVTEFRTENGVVDTTSERDLLFVEQPYPNHKGGQLAFDRNALLYVGMGDGGTNPDNGPTGIGDPENRAQNPASRLGKLLRIDPLQPNAQWEAVAYGLRNPWRFSFDRRTGDLWIGDVGPARYEEIDFRPAAQISTLANYGWSRFEGNESYNPAVTLGAGEPVFPTWIYNHVERIAGINNCGVIGGYVYRGTRLRSLRGRYVFGDLCSGALWSFRVGPNGRASRVTRLRGRVPELTSFGEGPNGELYAVGYAGSVYALR